MHSAEWEEQTLYPFEGIQILGENKKTVVGYRYPLYTLRDFKDQSYVLVMQTSQALVSFDNVHQV